MSLLDPKVNHGPGLNHIVWLLVSVSGVFLFTRLYLKNCQNRGLWWDDHALLTAWVAQTVQAGLVSYIVGLGYGRVAIPAETFTLLRLPTNLLSTLLIVANFLGKLSFALTLLRIPALWMRVTVCCIALSLVAAIGVSGVLVWIDCFSLGRRTDCIDVNFAIKYNIFSCGRSKARPCSVDGRERDSCLMLAFSAAVDITLAFLPWKFLWELQMSKKEKIGVMVAMSMGVL